MKGTWMQVFFSFSLTQTLAEAHLLAKQSWTLGGIGQGEPGLNAGPAGGI
jgi:hypothetical protein